MIQDNMVRAKFDQSVDMNNDCDEFLDLKECVNTAGHEKKSYDELIKGVNIACKKEGWQLELVKAREGRKKFQISKATNIIGFSSLLVIAGILLIGKVPLIQQ